MNLVLDQAVEVHLKPEGERTGLGRILLKGDNVTLISPAGAMQE